MLNKRFVNKKLERINQVFEILDKYPIKDVNVHRGDLCIDLEPHVAVTDSDREKLQNLDAHSQITKTSWEIFL